MKKERAKIVDNAIQTVEGFGKVFTVIHQNTVLKGQSKSTFHNYLRRIALEILHTWGQNFSLHPLEDP